MVTKHLIFKKRFWAGILLAQIVLFYLFSLLQPAIAFAEVIFEAKKKFHQSLFSGFRFSAGDMLYILTITVVLYWLVSALKKSGKYYGPKLLIMINIYYLIYQLFWGILYFQPPISDKLPEAPINIVEAKILAEKYLLRCIALRSGVSEDENGIYKIWNINEVKKDILTGQQNLPSTISQKKATGVSCFKPSVFGKMMNYTGIMGYYNPFTAEAQYDAFVPATSLPFTLAHESAHQLGFAREQEANFIGFLICENSRNKSLQYSADFFALKSLLNYIAAADAESAGRIVRRYSVGMARDRLYEKKFIRNHQGVLDDFFAFTNDLFLKSNQQEGSITYAYFTELLIIYDQTK